VVNGLGFLLWWSRSKSGDFAQRVNGRSYGGDLYDIQDEVEAYSRGKFFGGTGTTIRFIQSNYPSIRNRVEQRTIENTQVTPTVTRNFIISGVPTGLITIPHHYNQN